MPTRISAPPRGIPRHRLVLEFAFREPEDEIVRVALVLVDYGDGTPARPRLQLVQVEVGELPVIGERRDVVIEVSARHVRVPVRLDFLDELNHVGNMLRRLADDVGTADVHRVDVGKERVRVEACNLEHGLMPFLSRLHHLVGSVVGIARKMADISYVHHVLYVVAQIRERLVKDVKKNVGAEIPDVRVIIDRRAASIKADMSFDNRLELLHLPSHRVVQSQCHLSPPEGGHLRLFKKPP